MSSGGLQNWANRHSVVVCFLLSGNNFPVFIFVEGRFPLISTAWSILLLVKGTLFQGGKLLRRHEGFQLSSLIHRLSGALHLSRWSEVKGKLTEDWRSGGGYVTWSHKSGSFKKFEGNSRVPSWGVDPNKSPKLTLPSSERFKIKVFASETLPPSLSSLLWMLLFGSKWKGENQAECISSSFKHGRLFCVYCLQL